MFAFKFCLLTCLFYIILTVLLVGSLWAKVVFGNGLMIIFPKDHLGLKLVVLPGIVLGLMWPISFTAASFIVYREVKRLY